MNSLAQKCCSSTLNLLCQADAFKRGTRTFICLHCMTNKVEETYIYVNETNKETCEFFLKA